MPSDVSVRVDGLTKEYRLTAARGGEPDSLREAIGYRVRHPFSRQPKDTFRALDGVNLEIRQGEVLGVIGRNGAGKSTLLKLLSRVTYPTAGTISLYGSLGSLLEVGTGFHPELTGRENIYLSGAVMGLRTKDVRRQFDDIVEFADVARFLETPVKRYSSGMYVRLAFAVAAHIDPDILLIDEVLAVGDAQFQAKCLGRMEELGRAGRTVLFVSHSMPAIMRLCTRVVLLDHGAVQADDAPGAVVSRYVSAGGATTAERTWDEPTRAPGDDAIRLRAVRILGPSGQPSDELDIEKPFVVEVEWWRLELGRVVTPHLHFRNDTGTTLFVSIGEPVGEVGDDGVARARCHVPGNLLAEGRIFLLAGVATLAPPIDHVYEEDVVAATIVDRLTGEGARRGFAKDLPGVMRPLLKWTSE